MVSVKGQLDAPLLDIGQVEKEYWERKVVHLHSLAKFNKPKGWRKYFKKDTAPVIVLKRLTAEDWEKIDVKFHDLKVQLTKDAPVLRRITNKMFEKQELMTKEDYTVLADAKLRTIPIYIGMLELMIEEPAMTYEQVHKMWDCLDEYDRDTLASYVNMLTSEHSAVANHVNKKRLAEFDQIKAEAITKYGR